MAKKTSSLLALHGVMLVDPEIIVCGMHASGQQCLPCNVCVTAGPGFCYAIPATGQAEAKPPADIFVNNPVGPSISLSRQYQSLSSVRSEFGDGWTHPYAVGVSMSYFDNSIQPIGEPPVPPNWSLTGHIVEPNGARIQFTYEGADKPDATHLSIACTVSDPGMPIRVNWIWDTGTSSDRIEAVFKNRTRWVSEDATGTDYDHEPGSYYNAAPPHFDNFYRPIEFMYDRLGNWIKIVRTPKPGPWGDEPRITEIKDKNNATLLTFNLNGTSGYVDSVVDAYGRKVIYTTIDAPSDNIPGGAPQSNRVLTEVSQVVASGASSGPAAYAFSYDNLSNGEAGEAVATLETVSIPSPTGSGMATTTYHYTDDTNGIPRVDSITDPNGNVLRFVYVASNEIRIQQEDDSSNIVSKYSVVYDSNMQPAVYKDASGNVATWISRGASNYEPTEIEKHYDGSTSRTWTYQYDSDRNVIWSQSPKGIGTKSTYSYSNWWGGELTEVQQGTGSYGSFTPTRAKTSYTYYQPSGLLNTVSSPPPGSTSVTPTLQTTTYTYDGLGNILTIVSPGNNAEGSHTTTFNYTTDGMYSQSAKLDQPLTVQNGEGEKTHFRYDSHGNMTSTWDNLNHTTTFTYNIADQKLTTALPATGSSGGGNATTLNTYMWLGGPLSQVDSYSEAGGSAIRTVNFTYGLAGEMLTRTGSTEPVTLTYDAAYHTASVTDGVGSGHTTNYEYDLNGRLTEVDNPMASSTNFDQVHFTSYDRQGNLLLRTDGRGYVTSYVNGDDDGLLTEVNYTGASGEDVTIEYDDYDRVISTSNGTSLEEIVYDQANFVTSRDTTYTGMTGTKTLSYTYYPDGSRASLTHPGDSWAYEYDKAGRCTSLDSTAMGESGFEYISNGWMVQRNLPNGSGTSYDYNAVGMLTNLFNKNSLDQTDSEFSNFDYDGVFNLTSVENEVTDVSDMNGTVDFTYDTKDRLTNEASSRYGGYTETQVYDGAGNPTTFRSSSGKTYNGSNQRSNGTFTFDGNGNPTTWNSSAASYERENRLTSYANSTTTAGYRPDNLRAWRKYGSDPKKFFLYDNGSVICELEPDGDVVAHNVFAPDGLVGREEDSELNYYMFDQQGNVVHILNENEEETVHFAYNAWGSRNYAYPDGADKITQPFSYNGKWGYYMDAGTGLYYCQNRYYDPEQGRWLTRDPVGFAASMNKYEYCQGAPINVSDALGLFGAMLTPAPEIFYDGDYSPPTTPWIGFPAQTESPIYPCPREPFPVTPFDLVPAIGCGACLVLKGVQGSVAEMSSAGSDKSLHFLAGCLARIRCGAVCFNLGSQMEAFQSIGLDGKHSVSKADAVATEDGYWAVNPVEMAVLAMSDTDYCLYLLKKSPWCGK